MTLAIQMKDLSMKFDNLLMQETSKYNSICNSYRDNHTNHKCQVGNSKVSIKYKGKQILLKTLEGQIS